MLSKPNQDDCNFWKQCAREFQANAQAELEKQMLPEKHGDMWVYNWVVIWENRSLGFLGQVWHKPGCTVTEEGQKLEIVDENGREIVLSMKQTQRCWSASVFLHMPESCFLMIGLVYHDTFWSSVGWNPSLMLRQEKQLLKKTLGHVSWFCYVAIRLMLFRPVTCKDHTICPMLSKEEGCPKTLRQYFE